MNTKTNTSQVTEFFQAVDTMNIRAFTAENITASIVADTLKDSRTFGHHWPDDAQFCIISMKQAISWDENATVRFFSDETDFRNKLQDLCDFAARANNDAAMRVYRWDLGPEEIEALRRNVSVIDRAVHTNTNVGQRKFDGERNEQMWAAQNAARPKTYKADEYAIVRGIDFQNDSLETIGQKLNPF